MFIFSVEVTGCRIVKDVICFHGSCFKQVCEKLLLDLHEPPMSQVSLINFETIASIK